MKQPDINKRLILRYSLFQIPSLIIIMLLLYLIDRWYGLNNIIMMSIIAGWILKDIFLFPFVRKAYHIREHDKSKMMLYEKGTAVKAIDSIGFVRINGELWQAELADSNDPINKNDPIEVTEICGLKLKVKKMRSSDPIDLH